MPQHILNIWIVSTAIIMGLTILIWIVKDNKNYKWSVLPVALIIGSFLYIEYVNESDLIDDQKEIIRQELSDRYYVSSSWIDLVSEETKDRGNVFEVNSGDGLYQITFMPEETSGFELIELSGESLRGRKNAYETMKLLPDDVRPEVSLYLEYHSTELYKLEDEEGTWVIELDNDQVERIIDSKGVLRYEKLTDVGEEKEKNET